MPKKERIWGHNVNSEMVLWHLESRPQVRLTINWGQFVTIEMILWHPNIIFAVVDQAPKQVHTAVQVVNALHLGALRIFWWLMLNG